MMRWLIIGCLITIFISCGKNHNSILSVNEMKIVMWDMFNADNWYNQIAIKDSTAFKNRKNVALYQQVFQKDGVTREQFYTSYKYYQSHPDKMKVLLDSVEAYGERARNKKEIKPQVTAPRQITAPFIKKGDFPKPNP